MSDFKEKLSRNIKLYYLSCFFSGLAFIIPIWVAFERQFLSYGQMAMLEAVGALVVLGMELPTGALADLIGRKITVGSGWIIKAVGGFLQALASTSGNLVLGFLVASVGESVISGSDKALIFDGLKELGREKEFKKIESKHNLIFQMSVISAILTAGYLFQFWNGLPYLLYGIAQLICGIIYFCMQEPSLDSIKFSLKEYLKQTKQGFAEVSKNVYVKYLSIFYVVVGGITWSTQFFFNTPLATESGYSEIEMGWLFGTIRLINAIVLYKLVGTEKLLTKKRAFIGFPILMILVYLPGFWAGKYLTAILLLGASMASSSRFVILGQYTNEEFSSRNRATALSTLNMMVNLFYMGIVLVLGKIMEWQSPQLVYTILGGLSLVLALPLGIRLAKNHNQTKVET